MLKHELPRPSACDSSSWADLVSCGSAMIRDGSLLAAWRYEESNGKAFGGEETGETVDVLADVCKSIGHRDLPC